MQDQSHPTQKKFEIIQQWHRTRSSQKVYKIHLYMVNNMIKAQQRLRQKYQRPPQQSNNLPSTTSLNSRKGQQIQSIDDLLDNIMVDEDSNSTQNTVVPVTPAINPIPNPLIQERQIKIFENFTNRGKFDNLKFHFNRQKQRITIIILQNYFINELKCKQFDLLMVYKSFYKIWQDEYINILQAFIKYSRDFKAHEIIRLEFVAIDILGVTFDITYNTKHREAFLQQKRFRFRYSPFEFRQNPFFDEKNMQQIMSFVEIHSGNINSVSQQDFYTSMRLGFIDDINNNNSDLWRRMINRFWVFYQLHCLNRGMSDFQQFNKKALGRVHFHSIRMKKFQLIFPFQLLNKSFIEQRKQSTLYMTFYLQQKDININENGIEFKMTVNIVQHYGIVTYEQKNQLIRRLRREQIFTIIQKSPQVQSNELYEFFMTLKFDDKISRAFAKLQTIVSHFVDKIAFNDPRVLGGARNINMNMNVNNMNNTNDDNDTIEICSKQWTFKQMQYAHTHQLCLQLKHKFLSPVTCANNTIKYIDEIQYSKLTKRKRKWNERQRKDQGTQKCQLILHDDIKRYINQLLRSKPLRECYKQIMTYLQNVAMIIFKPFDDKCVPQRLDNRETLMAMIVGNIMRLLEIGNHHMRRPQIKIYTHDSQLMLRQQEEEQKKDSINNNILCQVTFNIKDLKIYWIKRLPQGYIIVRMGENFVEVVKDISWTKRIQIDWSNVQLTSGQLLKQLRNILMKEFATLQNMMV